MNKIIVLMVSILILHPAYAIENGDKVNSNNFNQKKMRIRIKDKEPRVYEIMGQFEKYLNESDLSQTHKERLSLELLS